jgi:hypothetical protein
MSLNKDFEGIYEFYVRTLMETIAKQNDNVSVAELRSIWKEIKTPTKQKKTRVKKKKETIIENVRMDPVFEKKKKLVEMMKYDDLYRHCIRNGIQQPPANKDDMIKVILTKMYPS